MNDAITETVAAAIERVRSRSKGLRRDNLAVWVILTQGEGWPSDEVTNIFSAEIEAENEASR